MSAVTMTSGARADAEPDAATRLPRIWHNHTSLRLPPRGGLMFRRTTTLALAAALATTMAVSAQGKVKQYGRATVQYLSDQVAVVANYDYSQKNHDGDWLLIGFAVQGRKGPIVIQRTDLSLQTPDGRTIPVATQQVFLQESQMLTPLFQNAAIWRRSLDDYFPSRPAQHTVNFFSRPGGIVHDSVMTHPDEVATGDLLFKAPDGKWQEGTHRLVLNHAKAKAELPINLQ